MNENFQFRYNQSENADDYTDSRKPPAPRSFRKMVNVTVAIDHRKEKVTKGHQKSKLVIQSDSRDMPTVLIIRLHVVGGCWRPDNGDTSHRYRRPDNR